jgi:hypothetical protein
MATKVQLDESTQKLVEQLQERERKEGRPTLSDARAANWLIREGARVQGLTEKRGAKS